MLFLVEMDHVKTASPMTPEAGRAFIEEVILPTLEGTGRLAAERKIVGGGPVIGRIALRLMVEAGSLAELDQMISSLPLWPLAETRVTPLVAFGERRSHVQALLKRLGGIPSQDDRP
jgi:muconolactone delta-isomerase